MPYPNTTQVPEVVVSVVPRPPDTPTPDCQAAGGVSLTLTKTDGRAVILLVRGLQPDETPRSIFGSTSYRGGSRRFDEYDLQRGADPSGRYSERLTSLETAPDGSSVVWDVRLVHARGVACATITVP